MRGGAGGSGNGVLLCTLGLCAACGARSGLPVDEIEGPPRTGAEDGAAPKHDAPATTDARAPIRDAPEPADARRDAQQQPVLGDAWPQRGHDPERSGRSRATTGSRPDVLWRVKLDESTDNLAPIVDTSGNVYASTTGHVYAFDRAGNLRWKRTGTAGIALDASGRLLVAEWGVLRWLSETGDVLQSTDLSSTAPDGGRRQVSEPLIGRDGDLYVATWGASGHEHPALSALLPDGAIRWSTRLAQTPMFCGSPAQGDDGALYVSLYVSGVEGRLVRVDRDGSLSWSRETGNGTRDPVVGPGGQVWVVTQTIGQPNLLAFSSAGDIRVALDMRSLISEPAAIDAQGNAYVGMAWGVAAVSPSGQQLWSARSAEPPNWYLHVWARPALSADGTLIVSDDTGAVRGVRDGAVVWSVERESIADHSISDSIAIGPDGTFYGGSLGTSYLYAMR